VYDFRLQSDLNSTPKKQKSKIPRLINNQHVYSKFAHSQMTKSQDSTLSSSKLIYETYIIVILLSGKPPKRPPSPGFIPVGHDYVSLIDFPAKSSDRGWPFVIDRTM
jgi:hypothetical protein